MRVMLGIVVGLSFSSVLLAPAAKADCICVELRSEEMTCFTVQPGPRCPVSAGRGGLGTNGSADFIPYDSLDRGGSGGSGGGGAGGNKLEADPILQLENFKSRMQKLRAPKANGSLN